MIHGTWYAFIVIATYKHIQHLTVSKILLDNLVRSTTATSLCYLFTSTVVSLGLTAFYSSSFSVRSSLQPYLSTVLVTSSTFQSLWLSSFIRTSQYSFHISTFHSQRWHLPLHFPFYPLTYYIFCPSASLCLSNLYICLSFLTVQFCCISLYSCLGLIQSC